VRPWWTVPTALLASCHLVAGLDGVVFQEGPPSGSGGAGTGGAGVGGSGGQGAAVANLDGNYHVDQGSALLGVEAASGVLANDLGEPPLLVTSSDTATSFAGSVIVNPDGGFNYTLPSPGFFGLDTFSYRLTDAVSNTDEGLVRVVVVPSVVEGATVAAGIGGFAIHGSDGELSGRSVSGAGDVNGDGLADLVIGAHQADPNSENSGASYVVFGKATGTAIELTDVTTGSGGFVIRGVTSNDVSGISVAGAGDVNGDGLSDVVIGANSAGGDNGAGYVVFGKTGGSAVELSDVVEGIGGFVIKGAVSGDLAGGDVAGAGDVNGDGLSDLLVGANGADDGTHYVVFGKSDTDPVELSDVNDGAGGFRIVASQPADFLGYAASGAGDVDGDGLADVVIGTSGRDSSTGAAYVVFGKSEDTAPVELETVAGGVGGFVINGIDVNDAAGVSVSSAGDLDGDGLSDVLIGANGVSSLTGAGYVVFGKGSGTAVDLTAVASGNGGFVINGVDEGDTVGFEVSNAGDVDGDGLADLVLGGPLASPNGGASGVSYVVFGRDAGPIELDVVGGGTGGFVVHGEAAGDRLGRGVAAAGDVNGDGYGDLIAGAYQADENGPDSGTSYVIFGGDFSAAVTAQGGPDDDVLTASGGSAKDAIVGDRGNDTLIGDGGPDVLLGGLGNDRLIIGDDGFVSIDGGGGDDVLGFGAEGMGLDLTQVPPLRIASIETIDLSGQGANLLTLELAAVRILSSQPALTVLGEAGDQVVFQVDDPEITSEAGFTLYSAGPVTLRVANAVDVMVR
jgi:hypothetical protein